MLFCINESNKARKSKASPPEDNAADVLPVPLGLPLRARPFFFCCGMLRAMQWGLLLPGTVETV